MSEEEAVFAAGASGQDTSAIDELRRKLRERRRALTHEERSGLSERAIAQVVARFGKLDLSGSTFGLYSPMVEEPLIAPFEAWLGSQGVKLAYPRISGEDITFAEAPSQTRSQASHSSHDRDWVKGPYSILEPSPSCPSVASETMDAVLVPGVAFGKSGERIGMGKGFYDRFLSRVPRALKFAICFDFQLLDKLPQHSTDVRVDWVGTDLREVVTPRANQWLTNRGKGG